MIQLLSRSSKTPDAIPGFPLRAAAVDVGSNAIRFLAAEFTGLTTYKVLAEVRQPVRLGHEVFLSGKLARSAMEAAVEAIGGFRERMEALNIQHYRAVATSATRESRNGDEFVARVARETGIQLEVITGREEARLVYEAIRANTPFGKKKWMLVDLGGGSVEVSLVDSESILWSESHTMGSVRLLEELATSGEEPGRFQRLLAEYAATLRIPVITKQWNPAGLIATGGNIEALARLVGADPGRGKLATVSLADLRGAIAKLSSMSYRERVDQLGLREDRADVILPAAMVYERVASLAGATEILVPAVGLKDGVLVDLVEDLTTHEAHEDRKERDAVAGALALGKRYLFDENHASHVARLAGSLFDQLQKVHRLDGADRRILMAASVLHDIGIFIGHKKHHKHSLYIIGQSEIPEFTPREIDIMANVARYHRKGTPAVHHENFTHLASDDRERVVKLASLLRVADALDREHLQAVRSVKASTSKTKLTLELEGEGDLLLERWALRRKAGLFTETFGLEVEVAGEKD
ncbi:Ppx/GppA phosphatase family protein [Longimicrobium terrae]|uniref:Exopolyphosphatase/guanosine-5'-triphosphate, 3'-diphosphate pyrophosphatase n=1 Tax=Longimicrobium terrae TaxID=1639882 RepID=A0A841H816_9BACT|nr:Ppx/GppA phosphatase family protein [Longimicrobium terrae]MBB4639646.1 exopolyphosphatase/guanosine-5'-triphosphate,3'-diphosphate pyrophosphatase [Longimicrobium terrae]MBB6074042.1 exopolyphosphatase/guanosine-5'-triphosphate,3'-diphosphate pyrophosphatase [Longimicrobium terrae]NNC29355.1 Ppx/GppA family phosphatase [Longimicrobium terrae]